MPVIEVKTKDDFARHLKAEKLVVVDFTAAWCGPCQKIKPFFYDQAEHVDFKSKIIFLLVDVDELEDVAADAGVTAMPTFQFYKNGQKVNELVGASKEKMEAMIRESLAGKAAENKEEKKEEQEEIKEEPKQ